MLRSVPTRAPAPALALLALTLITALFSCETESPSPVGEPIRETLPNGAVLVRYPDLPAIDSVSPEVAEAHVDLQFGNVDGTDPNLTFGAIRVQAAGDGTIYVLDQQAAEVRVFDSGGQYLRTIVRQGEGPGEIGSANGIFLSGDTLLWINDTRRWTILGVDPDGEEVRRFTKPVMSVTSIWAGVFDDRGRYWREISHSDNEPGFPPPVGLSSWTGRYYYKSYDLSNGAIDSIYLGEPRFRIYAYSTPDVPFGFLPLRFEPFEMIVVNPTGGFWRAHSESYRIARTGQGGDTLVVIEVGLPEQPVTDADRTAYVDSIVGERPELRREAEEVAALTPDAKPILAKIFVDDEHRLWVQRVTPEGAPAFYDLFSVDGDYLGSVRLAFVAAGPLVIRHGQIYTWIEDDLDVQYVVRAPVSWTREPLTEAELLGCYDVSTSGEWKLVQPNPHSPFTQRAAEILAGDSMYYEMPSRIQLAGPPADTMRLSGRSEITVPEGAAPSVHSSMSYDIQSDTLMLVFTTGYVGLAVYLTRSDDARWSGPVTTFDDYTGLEWSRPVQVTRASCDSPPAVASSVMLSDTASGESGPSSRCGATAASRCPTWSVPRSGPSHVRHLGPGAIWQVDTTVRRSASTCGPAGERRRRQAGRSR